MNEFDVGMRVGSTSCDFTLGGVDGVSSAEGCMCGAGKSCSVAGEGKLRVGGLEFKIEGWSDCANCK